MSWEHIEANIYEGEWQCRVVGGPGRVGSVTKEVARGELGESPSSALAPTCTTPLLWLQGGHEGLLGHLNIQYAPMWVSRVSQWVRVSHAYMQAHSHATHTHLKSSPGRVLPDVPARRGLTNHKVHWWAMGEAIKWQRWSSGTHTSFT